MEIVRDEINAATTLSELQDQENRINLLVQMNYNKYDLEKITKLYQYKRLELQPSTQPILSMLQSKEELPLLGDNRMDLKDRIEQDLIYPAFVCEELDQLTKIKSKSIVIENKINSNIFIPMPIISKVKGESDSFNVASVGRVQLLNLKNCKITIENPIKSDLYILNCQSCTIFGLCHQLRISNSHDLKLTVFCKSNPIQEHSTNISILPFEFSQSILENKKTFEFLLKRYKFSLHEERETKQVIDFNHKES